MGSPSPRRSKLILADERRPAQAAGRHAMGRALPSGIVCSRAATRQAAARRLSPDRCRRLPEEDLSGFGTVGRLGLEFLGAGVSAFRRGARLDGLEPALQMRKILEL